MKITKRQLRSIIREAIDNAGNEIPDVTKRQSWKDRLEDPDYMAGKKAGERDRMNDPHADHSFIEREEVYEGTSPDNMSPAWQQILKGIL
jgi:hypothetical protein